MARSSWDLVAQASLIAGFVGFAMATGVGCSSNDDDSGPCNGCVYPTTGGPTPPVVQPSLGGASNSAGSSGVGGDTANGANGGSFGVGGTGGTTGGSFPTGGDLGFGGSGGTTGGSLGSGGNLGFGGSLGATGGT